MNFTCGAGPFKNMIFIINMCLSYSQCGRAVLYERVFSQPVEMEDDIYTEDVSLAMFCGLIPSHFSSIQDFEWRVSESVALRIPFSVSL